MRLYQRDRYEYQEENDDPYHRQYPALAVQWCDLVQWLSVEPSQ